MRTRQERRVYAGRSVKIEGKYTHTHSAHAEFAQGYAAVGPRVSSPFAARAAAPCVYLCMHVV